MDLSDRRYWVMLLGFLLLPVLGRACFSKSGTTVSTPESSVTTKTTPSPGPIEPPVIIRGTITTANNYTAALEDPTSLAFKTFENSFIAAVISFYAENKEYIGYYVETVVSTFEPSNKQVVVHFEIRFTQLDNDDVLPDAHTVLSDQIGTGRLGTFLIITGSLRKS